MKLTKEERDARTIECETCGAAAGEPCVYTDGPYRGTPKLSGAHGGRLAAAFDARQASS